jgi:hypothetical protein
MRMEYVAHFHGQRGRWNLNQEKMQSTFIWIHQIKETVTYEWFTWDWWEKAEKDFLRGCMVLLLWKN